MSLAPLRQPHTLKPDKAMPTRLDRHRGWLNSAGVLLFDFSYGDFVRYVGGEYVNHGRDHNAEWDIMRKTMHGKQVLKEYPPVQFEMAYRIQTEGAPLRAQYTTPISAMVLQNNYDNHPAVPANAKKVEEEFA